MGALAAVTNGLCPGGPEAVHGRGSTVRLGRGPASAGPTLRRRFVAALAAAVMLASPLGAMASQQPEQIDVTVGYRLSIPGGGTAIFRGGSFDLIFRFDFVTTGSRDDIKASIEFEDGAFRLESGWNYADLTDAEVRDAEEKALRFTYDGTEPTVLRYAVNYRGADGILWVRDGSINIREAIPYNDSTSPPTSNDTRQHEPRVTAVVEKVLPSFTAGRNQTLEFRITNLDWNRARDVIITPEASGSGTSIEFRPDSYARVVESLSKDEEAKLSFGVSIGKDARPGLHQVPFLIQYKNVYGDAYERTVVVPVIIENDLTPPSVSFHRVSADPPTDGGDVHTLWVTLRNSASTEAHNVRVTISDMDGSVLSIAEGFDFKEVPGIRGGESRSVPFPIRVDPKAAAGGYRIGIRLEYEDKLGGRHGDSATYFLPVEGGPGAEGPDGGQGKVALEGTADLVGLAPGSSFELRFAAVNVGDGEVRGLTVTFGTDYLIVPKTLPIFSYDSLAPGDVRELAVTFLVGDDAQTRNYPIAVNVSYEAGKDGHYAPVSYTQHIGAAVERPGDADGQGEDKDRSTPKVIVDYYAFEPATLEPGMEFDLTLTLYNTSRQHDVRNMKVTLLSHDGTFIPVESSNSFYIVEMGRDSRAYHTIRLRVNPSSTSMIYVINVDIAYEGVDGMPINAGETISIPVRVDPILVVGDIMLPYETGVMSQMWTSVNFYNMGKVTIYNLLVSLEGEFQSMTPNYFAGTLDTGRTDSFDSMFMTPYDPGMKEGMIVFTYEDISGKKYRHEAPFTMNVVDYSEYYPPDGGDQYWPPDEGGGEDGALGGPALAALIGGSALLVGAMTGAVVLRVRRGRKEIPDDE